VRILGKGSVYVAACAVLIAVAISSEGCGGGSSAGGRWGGLADAGQDRGVTGTAGRSAAGGGGRGGSGLGGLGGATMTGLGGLGGTTMTGLAGLGGATSSGLGGGVGGSGAGGAVGGRGAGGAVGGSGAGGAVGGRGAGGAAGGATTDAGTDSGPARAAGADAALACDPIHQTGCPAGAKCGVPPTCFTNGTVGDGMLCASTGFDDCAAPDICVGDGVGHVCRQVCGVDADCGQRAVAAGTTSEPGNLPRCLITLVSSTFSVCTDACNPVPKAGASGCPQGYACGYFHTATVPELTDCEPPGTVTEGGDCTTAGCAGGLVCVSTATTNRCRQLCRTATNADCDVVGDTCIAPSGIPSPMFGFCCAPTGC
jgi:hypothetical protein